jgi:hypothetical protein
MSPVITPHTVTLRAFQGAGGMGPTYGAPVSVKAFVLEEQKLVRASDASEVVSSTQVYCAFDVVAPPGSLVTVWPGTAAEREATVITSAHSHHPTIASFQRIDLT